MPYALYLTKNEADAKDLLHDAFIKLDGCNYEERGLAAAMIKRVILNRFIDMCRARKRWGHFIDPDFAGVSVSDNGFEKEDLTNRQRAIIARYLYNLSPRDKKIWELYLDKFSGKEMSELMSMNQNAVLAVLFRIREKLKKTINP